MTLGYFYIRNEEKSLKREQEKLIEIDQLQDEFVHNKNDLLNACFDYFQEMKRKIDLHREETKEHLNDHDLIKKIHDVSLQMIEEIKKFEASFLNEFDFDLIQIEQTLRELNLDMESLNKLKTKHEQPIATIELKLNQIKKLENKRIQVWF